MAYIVMVVFKSATTTGGEKTTFGSPNDGCVGVCPVFRTKKDAQRFAGKKYEILKLSED